MPDKAYLKFKKILKFVWENKISDFYYIKFKKTGFNPISDFNSLKDIKKIPYLTKKELLDVNIDKLLFLPKDKNYSILHTSGITGESLLFFLFPIGSLPLDDLYQGRILILKPPALSHLAFLTFYNSAGSNYFLLGDIHNLPATCQLAQKAKINKIVASPSLAIVLENYLKYYPDLKKSINFFFLGGEPVTSQKKKYLRKIYPNSKFISSYSCIEAGGPLGSQCKYLAERDDKTYYHINSQYYYEIINSNNEKEVHFGKKGELVFTNFCNLATPMIRYKTGDLVSLRENNCFCGAEGPLLEIHGRINYDIVNVGGFELRSEMLERSLMNLSYFVKDEFEAHFYETFVENKPKIKTELNLSLREGVVDSSEIRRKIEQEVLENWRLSPRLNLKKAVEVGLFDVPQINFVRFPQTAKTIRKLILH